MLAMADMSIGSPEIVCALFQNCTLLMRFWQTKAIYIPEVAQDPLKGSAITVFKVPAAVLTLVTSFKMSKFLMPAGDPQLTQVAWPRQICNSSKPAPACMGLRAKPEAICVVHGPQPGAG